MKREQNVTKFEGKKLRSEKKNALRMFCNVESKTEIELRTGNNFLINTDEISIK